jgi:hypothetical protein
MPFAPTDFDEQPTRNPERMWLDLACGHSKMILVSEKEKYPIGRETLCSACKPMQYQKILHHRSFGEPKKQGGKA